MMSESSTVSPEVLEKVGPIEVGVVFSAFSTPSEALPSWRLTAVEPLFASPAASSQCWVGAQELWLFRDEALGYYLNLESPDPSIFVKWRLDGGDALNKASLLPNVIAVTLSYDEAGRWLDASESVDRVPMPEEMRPWLAEFAQTHYKPEEKKKRRGQKPSFMSRQEFAKFAEVAPSSVENSQTGAVDKRGI
jgi:Protein of unknown function (DUF3305)